MLATKASSSWDQPKLLRRWRIRVPSTWRTSVATTPKGASAAFQSTDYHTQS